MTTEVDLLIIGAGPTGLYAAYYAGFRGMKVALVDSLTEPGGQLMALYPEKPIYDVAGYPSVLARDLANRLIEQASSADPTYLLGRRAETLTQQDDGSLLIELDNGDSVQTGADGRAEVLIERTGDQNVRVNGEGYVNYSKSHDCDPTAVAPQIRVALTPSVPCAGQVVLPSGQTVTDDWIGLMITEKGSNEQNWHSVNKEDLTFTINGMSPGSFSARLWTGGSQSSSVEFDLGPNGDSNLVLQFNIGG